MRFPPRPSQQPDITFLLEEYRTCRQQILDNIKAEDQLEVYSVGAVAAVFVFTLSQTDTTIVRIALGLSSLIAAFALVRFIALDITIGVTNAYLREVENRIGPFGWTNFYQQHRAWYLKASRYGVAIALFLVTIASQIALLAFGPFWIVKSGGHFGD